MRRSEAGNEGHIEAVSMWTANAAVAATLGVCALNVVSST